MGWMEVLALLKRLGPTLSRLVPMLEMFVATRAGTRGDTEAAGRVAAEIKDDLATAARNHAALTDLLTGQARQVEALADALRHIREADERCAARLLEVETQVSTLGSAVHQARQLLVAMLGVWLASLIAVLVLLLRR